MARRLRYASRSVLRDAFKKRYTWKPPRGQTNDGEISHLLSGNILYDPGLELFVGNTAESWSIHDWNTRTGEDTFTLPVFDLSCQYAQRWPSGECVDYKDQAQWVGVGLYDARGGVDDSAWQVTRLDKYLGYFAMAWWNWTRGPLGNPQPLLVLSPGLAGGYSARVDGGDLITWSVRARMYPVNPGGTPTIEHGTGNTVGGLGGTNLNLQLWYYNKAGDLLVGGQGGNQNITTAFTEFTYQTTAPSGSYYLRAMVAFYASSPGSLSNDHDPTVLVDSGVLSIE